MDVDRLAVTVQCVVSVGVGYSWEEVWLQDERQGQEGSAKVPARAAGGRHQLRDVKVGAGWRQQGGLEHGEHGVR